MITAASFRNDFTEFASAVTYPVPLISYYLAIGTLLLNQPRWGSPGPAPGGDPTLYTEFDFGLEFFVAHNLVLEAQSQAEANNGAPPGVSKGPINSQSVDKVSVGYDTTAGIEEGAGHWNLTKYGTRFIRLAKMMGAGPIQLGVPNCGGNPLASYNAWQGPWYSNYPNPSG